jgi:hypothetical protein
VPMDRRYEKATLAVGMKNLTECGKNSCNFSRVKPFHCSQADAVTVCDEKRDFVDVEQIHRQKYILM